MVKGIDSPNLHLVPPPQPIEKSGDKPQDQPGQHGETLKEQAVISHTSVESAKEVRFFPTGGYGADGKPSYDAYTEEQAKEHGLDWSKGKAGHVI